MVDDSLKEAAARYFRILRAVTQANESAACEEHLSDAFELGRSLMDQQIPPDEVTHIHHLAVTRLSREYPELVFSQVADRLNRPLMEMSMAYGLAFREQMEKRYQALVAARLEQSQKLESVGTLAAGIAHDFNNLLGSIIGFAEMLGDEMPEGSTGQHSVRQILIAGFRARDLVAKLLAFARQQPGKPAALNVVSQVREALGLLRASYQPDLAIRFETGIEQATVMADPGQLHQIVMNLCINAADAMNGRGAIDIAIEAIPAGVRSPLGERIGVCLTVADAGHGMPPELQQRIFDPFFTTKAPDKGSGLGLSMVHGIVSQLGGAIALTSRVAGNNPGTEFRVYLPLAGDTD